MKYENLCKSVNINRSFFRPAAPLLALFALGSCSGSSPMEPPAAGGGINAGGSSNSSGTGGANTSGGISGKATGGTSTAATGGNTQGNVTGGQGNGTGGASIGTGAKPGTGGAGAGGVSTATGGVNTATGGAGAGGVTTAIGGKSATDGAATGGAQPTGGTTSKASTSATGGSSPTGGTTSKGGATAATGGAATGGAAAGGAAAGGASENSGANCNATSAALLSAEYPQLPNPFAMHDGSIISTQAQWECRRNEIKADIEKYEIGPKPDPSTATVKATLSGSNLSVVVTTSSGSITLKSAVTGSGSCVVIGQDMDLGYVTGCTKILFSTSDVIPYNNDTGAQSQSDPFYKVYPSLWGKIGNYNAWAWGTSRLIDGLGQVKDQLKIDMTKIAVHGCSYAGKMALFSGAFDERVALTVVEESGGGGIDAWRASADYTKRTGVSVEKINNTNYAWFMSSMQSLDPYKLPHDHHELIAMIAPRATIILGNDDYDWLGDESGYKSTIAAIEVFKALGVADHIGYDFTSGHSHCVAPQTQLNSINTFVTRFLKGGTTSPNIAIKPTHSGYDLSTDFTWTTPTLTP